LETSVDFLTVVFRIYLGKIDQRIKKIANRFKNLEKFAFTGAIKYLPDQRKNPTSRMKSDFALKTTTKGESTFSTQLKIGSDFGPTVHSEHSVFQDGMETLKYAPY